MIYVKVVEAKNAEHGADQGYREVEISDLSATALTQAIWECVQLQKELEDAHDDV